MSKNSLLAFMMAAGLGASAFAASPQASQTLTLTDWTGRGFAPDRVAYVVPAAVGPAALRVQDADGRPLPVQLFADGTGPALAFVAAVPPGGSTSYVIRTDGVGPAAPPAVTVTPERGALVLANQFLAVRVPAPVEKTFAKPVSADTLPAPVLAFRGPDRKWRGEGAMLAGLPVRRFSVTRAADGPVFAEVRYRLDFEGGGYYQASVRVTDRSPLADITEEYDLGRLDNRTFWQLELSKGWKPDEAEFMTAMGQGVAPVTRLSLSDLEAKIPHGVNGWDLPNQDVVGGTPVRFLFPEGWGARYVTCFGLHRKDERAARSNDYPLAHVVTLHKGNWRRPNSMPVLSQAGRVRVLLPMAVSPRSWLTETGSDVSPFSCHEHDPALPVTFGRRQWGLLLAHPELTVTSPSGIGPGYSAANLYGTVGLDRYKDFILAWPDRAAGYPRVFLKTNEVTRFRAALTNAAEADLRKELKDYYVFSGDPAAAPREVKRLDADLDEALNHIMSMLAIGHHHTYKYAAICAHADSVLSWPELPAADRARLRSKLALLAHLMIEPDVMSHGTGSHHGNPNMGVSRQMDMLNVMALLPDHPLHATWRDYMAMYMVYKTGSFMAPGGAWFEYGSAYHMHGYGKILRGLMGLYASGESGLAPLMREYHRQDFEYFMNLLTPFDPRYGSRMVPGNANSGRGNCSEFLMAMGTFADSDPDLAAAMRWAWEANGRGASGLAVPTMARPWIAPKEPALASRAYPGFGVIFRANQGADETYLFFRSGYLWSHWPIDQNHLFLYAKGAPLIPDQPYQYYTSPDQSFDPYNLIRFGSVSNRFPHAWPDSNILDYRFGGNVEYAWSSSGYPDWFNTPGAAPGWEPLNRRPLDAGLGQTPGAFTWDRQVLFLKGKSDGMPQYFVVRDSTRGPGRLASWFNLNLLGRQTNIQVSAGRVAVETEWPARLDILFPGRAALPFAVREDNAPVQYGPYSRLTRAPATNEVLSRDWLAKDGALATIRNVPAFERQVQLRLPGQPGEDYFWVLAPRGPGEPALKATLLAPGVMKVEPANVVAWDYYWRDYVFLSPTNMVYRDADVTFEGKAGVVRIGKSKVTESLLAGPGRIGFGTNAVESSLPFETTTSMVGMKWSRKPGSGPAPASGPPAEPAVTETAAGVRFSAPNPAYVELARGPYGVKGKGPFDLTFTPSNITGRVDGDLRTLVTTWPETITRPMYRQDGVRWYAGFGDEHSIVKGAAAPQFSLAFGVSAGPHTVAIGEWEWPALPPAPARRGLEP